MFNSKNWLVVREGITAGGILNLTSETVFGNLLLSIVKLVSVL